MRIRHSKNHQDIADLVATFLYRERDYFYVETENDTRAGLERITKADGDCVVSAYDTQGLDGLGLLKHV